jgi:Flp pilus assembly protein TadG
MKTKRNKGQALIEMTLLLPLFIVLTLLVADLARIFYFSMGMTHAVRAGVQYGFQHSTDSDGMIAAAVAAGSDVGLTTSELTPAPYRYWRCPSDATTTENSSFPIPANSCGADQPLTYVRVEATKDFTTIYGGYAWIPETVTVTRVAQIRVP